MDKLIWTGYDGDNWEVIRNDDLTKSFTLNGEDIDEGTHGVEFGHELYHLVTIIVKLQDEKKSRGKFIKDIQKKLDKIITDA